MPKTKVSIVPDKLSPLKVRGFLRGDAQDLQKHAEGTKNIIVMRVFLPTKARFGAERSLSRLGLSRTGRVRPVDGYAAL